MDKINNINNMSELVYSGYQKNLIQSSKVVACNSYSIFLWKTVYYNGLFCLLLQVYDRMIDDKIKYCTHPHYCKVIDFFGQQTDLVCANDEFVIYSNSIKTNINIVPLSRNGTKILFSGSTLKMAVDSFKKGLWAEMPKSCITAPQYIIKIDMYKDKLIMLNRTGLYIYNFGNDFENTSGPTDTEENKDHRALRVIKLDPLIIELKNNCVRRHSNLGFKIVDNNVIVYAFNCTLYCYDIENITIQNYDLKSDTLGPCVRNTQKNTIITHDISAISCAMKHCLESYRVQYNFIIKINNSFHRCLNVSYNLSAYIGDLSALCVNDFRRYVTNQISEYKKSQYLFINGYGIFRFKENPIRNCVNIISTNPICKQQRIIICGTNDIHQFTTQPTTLQLNRYMYNNLLDRVKKEILYFVMINKRAQLLPKDIAIIIVRMIAASHWRQ